MSVTYGMTVLVLCIYVVCLMFYSENVKNKRKIAFEETESVKERFITLRQQGLNRVVGEMGEAEGCQGEDTVRWQSSRPAFQCGCLEKV